MNTDIPIFSVAALIKQGAFAYYRRRKTKRRVVTQNMIRGDRFAKALTDRNRGRHECGGVVVIDGVGLSFRIDAYIAPHFVEIKWVNPLYHTAPTLLRKALVQVSAYNRLLDMADRITDLAGEEVMPDPSWKTMLYFDSKMYEVDGSDEVIDFLVAKAKAIHSGDINAMLDVDTTLTVTTMPIPYRLSEHRLKETVAWTV